MMNDTKFFHFRNQRCPFHTKSHRRAIFTADSPVVFFESLKYETGLEIGESRRMVQILSFQAAVVQLQMLGVSYTVGGENYSWLERQRL